MQTGFITLPTIGDNNILNNKIIHGQKYVFKPTPIFSVTRENLHPFGTEAIKVWRCSGKKEANLHWLMYLKHDDFQSLYFLQYFKGYLGNVSLVLVRSW